MEDWDGFGSFDIPAASPGPSRSTPPAGGGRWYWPLTLVCILLAVVFSFLMAFLTRNDLSRSALLTGLIFALPIAAMFIGAMLLECRTGAMATSCPHTAQFMIVILGTLITFFAGFLGNLIYHSSLEVPITAYRTVQVTAAPVPTGTPPHKATPSPTPRHPASHPSGDGGHTVVFLLDESASMLWGGVEVSGRMMLPRDAAEHVLTDTLASLPSGASVGLVPFTEYITNWVTPAANTVQQQNAIRSAMRQTSGFSEDLSAAIRKGIDLIPNTVPSATIILISDGTSPQHTIDASALTRDLNAHSITFSVVYINGTGDVDAALDRICTATGGHSLSLADYLSGTKPLTGPVVTSVPTITPSPTPPHRPTPTRTPTITPAVTAYTTGIPYQTVSTLAQADQDYDLLRATHSSRIPQAKWITLAVLLLRGLIIGLGLTLMLSTGIRFRWQLIISPLMALLSWVILVLFDSRSAAWWIVEGTALTLSALVFMADSMRGPTRNRRAHPSGGTGYNAPASSQPISSRTNTNLPDDW